MRSTIAAAAVWMLAAGPAFAQAYPSKPVTIIVNTSTGSSPDVLARHLAPLLAQRLGQPFVVDSRAGASGTIGALAVAKAPPDGHTLLMTAVLITMVPALTRDQPFDPARDFEPIGTLAKATLALVVHPSVPANTLTEYMALARSKPGELNFGSPGVGTPHHLIIEMIKLQEKVSIVHVPYKGTTGMIASLLAGETSGAFFALVAAVPQAKAGKLKVLAVMGEKRADFASHVPTFREQNMENMDMDQWMALFAPAKTPRDITRRVNQEVMPMVELPAIKEVNMKGGILPMPGTPEQLGALVKTELARWQRVVKEAGIKPE